MSDVSDENNEPDGIPEVAESAESDDATPRAEGIADPTSTRRSLLTRGPAQGAPVVALLALAVVLLAVLLVISGSGGSSPQAYAELVLGAQGCTVDTTHSRDALGCTRTGPGIFIVRFSGGLADRTAIVSPGSCCAVAAGASVTSPETVTLAVAPKSPASYPIAVTVVVL